MSFRYGSFFEVLHVGDSADDLETLRRELGLRGTEADSPATRRLFELVAPPKCRSVVLERQYIDLDFRKGFGRFHYIRHFDMPRRCTRVHFFGCRIRRQHLETMPPRVKEQYLGFTVMRPLPAHRLGRSILSDSLAPHGRGLGDNYITCKTAYEVSLAGNRIAVNGTPYMEQDTLVLACATASLWMASWHMAHRFTPEFKAFFTPEITDLSTRYTVETGRAMPSEGLTFEQMLCGLREMGYEPWTFEPRVDPRTEAVRNVVYRYVESEIPVILSLLFFSAEGEKKSLRVRVVGGHAVSVVGHTFDLSINPKTTEVAIDGGQNLRYCLSSEFVPAFIVQDDSGGPFRLVQFLEPSEVVQKGLLDRETLAALENRIGEPHPFVLFDEGTGSQELVVLMAVMVPLPEGVTLSGYFAEQRALRLLAFWMSQQPRPNPKTVAVLRTFLQLSNEAKDRFSVLRSRLGRRLRRHLLSRWVWVTEISDLESLRSDQLVMGQVLQDSAGGPGRSPFTDVLAFNFPPLVALLSPDGSLKAEPLPDYSPYPQFSRPSA